MSFPLFFLFGLIDWNRPELIRDYDPAFEPLYLRANNLALKQTWIDKGLRPVQGPGGVVYCVVILKQTWIDKGLRPSSCRSNPSRLGQLKQTWIDKGLRPLEPYRVTLCPCHWNRPELIRDYDQLTIHSAISPCRRNWNRPELIRDYDEGAPRSPLWWPRIETDLNW